jgi:hypothetical protein
LARILLTGASRVAGREPAYDRALDLHDLKVRFRVPGPVPDRSGACKLATSLGYAGLAMAASADKDALNDVLA